MKNRDTVLLEEAYNKTRLLKEGGDQPMSVEDHEKIKHAEWEADNRIAPGLKTSSFDSITRKLSEIGNVIADQFPEEAKYLISLDSELNSLKDKLGRD